MKGTCTDPSQASDQQQCVPHMIPFPPAIFVHNLIVLFKLLLYHDMLPAGPRRRNESRFAKPARQLSTNQQILRAHELPILLSSMCGLVEACGRLWRANSSTCFCWLLLGADQSRLPRLAATKRQIHVSGADNPGVLEALSLSVA